MEAPCLIQFFFKLEDFPFLIIGPLGVIRMGSQYESEKVGIILAQEELSGLHLVQFECPRHWKSLLSATGEVGGFSILGSLFTFYRAGDEKSIGVLRLDSPSESAPFGSLFAKLATFHLLG